MRWLIFILALSAVSLSGCAKLNEMIGTNTEETEQADTADVDLSGDIEALPATEDGAMPAEGDQVAEATEPAPADMPAADPMQPAEQPAEQAADPMATGTGEFATYTVQNGDTLMKIAFNIYGDILRWKDLHELNRESLGDANILTAGQQLKYDKPAFEPAIERNGEPYMIKRGDTLGTIADDIYAKVSKWRKLYENNKTLIRDPNRIYAGFYLYYQITEEERMEAERIKAERAPRQQLGTTEPAPAPAAPADSAPVGGGLDTLAVPDARAPGSQ